MWMDERSLDRMLRVMEDYAPEAYPFARYLGDWRDVVKRGGGAWDQGVPGAAGARDLIALLDRADRAVRLRTVMPTEDEFRRALDPIRAAAFRFGLDAPELVEPDASTAPAP